WSGFKLHERRFERAPSEVDDKRLDEHELTRELRQTGHLLYEVILIEAVQSGFGVQLRIRLRPAAGPVARQPDAGDSISAALVHRTLHGALKAAVDARLRITRLDVDSGPVIFRRRPRNRFDEPDVVVV